MKPNLLQTLGSFALKTGNSYYTTATAVWSSFIAFEKSVILIFTVVFIFFCPILWTIGKLEYVPTSLGALITAMFAFLAYRFSKEKFRLDLSQHRWAIYESLMAFCSLAMQSGLKSEQAIKAAEGSFRGMGYHRSLALFGEDIAELFKKLNESYSWLNSFSTGPAGNLSHNEWAEKTLAHESFIWETVNKLPEHFKEYLYFGDYKR